MAEIRKSSSFNANVFLSPKKSSMALLFNSIHDPLIVFDTNGKIINVNKAAEKLFRRKLNRLVNREVWGLLPGDTVGKKKKSITTTIRSGRSYRIHLYFDNRSYDALFYPAFNGKRKTGQFFMMAHEITDEGKNKKMLKGDEEKYRQIVETAEDIIFCIDLKGQLTYINKAGQKISGYSEKELLKQNLSKFLAPEYFEIINKGIKKRIAGDNKRNIYELEFINKSGMHIPIEAFTSPLLSNGKPIGILGIARDISERRQLEFFYKTLVEQSLLGIMVYTFDRMLFVNQAAADILGYSKNQLIDKTPDQLVNMVIVDDKALTKKRHKKRFRGELLSGYSRLRIKRKDKHICWVEVVINQIDYQGEMAFMVFFIDITEKTLAEEALKESEEKYRAVTEAARDIIFTTDLNGQFTFMNTAGQTLSGYPLNKLLKMNVTDFIVPSDAELLTKKIKARKDGNRKIDVYEAIFVTRNGTKIPIEVSSSPLIQKGNNMGMIAIGRDIRERKHMETAYKTIVEQSLLGIIIYSKYKILFANQAAADIFGYTLEELIKIPQAKAIKLLIPPEDQLWIKKEQENVIKGKSFQGNYIQRIIRKDGAVRWLQVTVNPIEYQNQPATQLFFIDRTEKIKAINALKESEERYRTFLQQFRGIAYRGKLSDWTFIFIHGAIEEITGYKRKDFLERRIGWDKLIHPDDYENIVKGELARKVCKVPHYSGEREYRIIRKDKAVRWIYELFNNICNDRGKPEIIQGTLFDITEKKQMEQELLKIQKLESIGVLAGGIAHDFNNLLTAILGNITLANANFKSEEYVYELLKDAENASLRAKDLAQQLLTFSRGGLPVKKTIQIEKLIKDTARFSTRGTNIICKFYLSKNLFPVEVDEGQMVQVINNLIINAIQAMSRGGVITISAKNTVVDEDQYIPLAPGKYIKITIKDQGMGIPRDTILNVFDPYFSTKQRGNGLGLTISYSIIKKHNGYISAESKVNRGTIFTIYLPASEKKIKGEGRGEKEKLITGKGKILVMDDEELILTVVAKILNNLGYQVETAKDGTEVIAMYTRAKKSIAGYDAVILDLTVHGGMGGKETMEQLLQIDPGVKALVSSGYSVDPVMANYKNYGFAGIITKPYNANQLGEALKKLIRH